MGAADIFRVIAMVSAALSAIVIVHVVASAIHRLQTTRVTDVANVYNGMLASVFRNGIPGINRLSRWLVSHDQILSYARTGVELCQKRHIVTTPTALLSIVIVCGMAIALVALCVSRTVLGGAALFVCYGAVLIAFVRSVQDKQSDEVREAVPDALRSMSSCFQAGYSLAQTFQQLTKETKGRLQTLFSYSLHVLQTGGTASEALERLRSDESVPELNFVAVALDVQHQSGGSMQSVLDSARDMVEDELQLERSMKVQTAQARLSMRIVSLMPVILIALFSMISSDFLAPFFESFAGLAMLAIALTMQITGVLLARRMLKVSL